MNFAVLLVISGLILVIAYFTYGKYVENTLGVNPNLSTPAHTMGDGVDYVPAKPAVLLGHHFATIAGAGPIVGPITAAVFGWVPAVLWIIIGGIFVGGVHDYSSLVASVRHKGKSIGQIIKNNIGKRGQLLFLIFAWATLILVVAVFTILVANTFAATPETATASILLLILAIIFGVAVYRFNVPLIPATIFGVILLFVSIAIGISFPLALSATTWVYILIGYAFIASVTPVWVLLQPRDYLNSFLLYAVLGGAFVGIIVGQPDIAFPAYIGFKTNLGYLFPILFVTIACGAISGFHSLVSSGTTSKQLSNEKDAKIIGYGGMLIESFLAIIAIGTVAVLSQQGYTSNLSDYGGPVGLFGAGVGSFMSYFGIPIALGTTFATLAVSAFLLTSLDSATRLARYTFQEFTEERMPALNNTFLATGVSLVFAAALALSGQWSTIWPIFGSANQLLAGLALLGVSVWLGKLGKSNKMTLIPMVFMIIVTLAALINVMSANLFGAKPNYILGIAAVFLFILAILLVLESWKSLFGSSKNQPPISSDM
ncbi:MAG: carbon starvation protein A [Bacillota bacterium]|nr:carbon starvation protein A [Bacillota bacterium]